MQSGKIFYFHFCNQQISYEWIHNWHYLFELALFQAISFQFILIRHKKVVCFNCQIKTFSFLSVSFLFELFSVFFSISLNYSVSWIQLNVFLSHLHNLMAYSHVKINSSLSDNKFYPSKTLILMTIEIKTIHIHFQALNARLYAFSFGLASLIREVSITENWKHFFFKYDVSNFALKTSITIEI